MDGAMAIDEVLYHESGDGLKGASPSSPDERNE